MKLEFVITNEDLKAFYIDTLWNSPGVLKTRWMQALGFPAFILFLVYIGTRYTFGVLPTLIALLPAVWAGRYLWNHAPGVFLYDTIDNLVENKQVNHTGRCSLEIDRSGIRERNNAGEHFSYWREISRIDPRDDYTYFVTRAGGGYILPHRDLDALEINGFVAEAMRYLTLG